MIELNAASQKYYGCFNNIRSVARYQMNEIMWLKLVQTYCLPRLLYSCQIWPREVAYRLNTIYNTRPKSTEKDAIWTYFQHTVHFSHFSLFTCYGF